jgi:hypothetical protein
VPGRLDASVQIGECLGLLLHDLEPFASLLKLAIGTERLAFRVIALALCGSRIIFCRLLLGVSLLELG